MSPRAKTIVVLALMLFGLVIFWLFSSKELSPKSSSQTQSNFANPATSGPLMLAEAEEKARKERAEKAFDWPISFWGKVVDQNGIPVAGAQVLFHVVVRPMSDKGPEYNRISDSNGLFSIENIKGGALGVHVSKEGYYDLQGQSAKIIGYGIENENKPPSPDDPTIFVLRRKGNAESLKVYSSGGIRVPKNGIPVDVSLHEGKVMSGEQGDIQVAVWTQDQQKDAQRRYPWKCRISVPGGGLVERKGNFDFIAPAEGYSPAVEISMNQAAERWQKSFDGQYFAKLKDGTFARFTLNLTTGGDHFFMVESYVNPAPGNRNLEFDPEKTIKSP